MKGRPSVVLLLHLAEWKVATTEHRIAPNVTLCRFPGSKVEKLYRHLCFEQGIDDGEPLMYGSYIRLEPTPGEEYLLDIGDPYSLGDRVANLLAVARSHPISWSRVISSRDDFRTSDGTQELHQAGYQTDFLERAPFVLDGVAVNDVGQMWSTIDPLWKAEKSAGRLTNALLYFYYAWRAHYVEQMCLNLAIVLEVLFAPHSQAEATHQLCFNLSRFTGADPAAREDLYRRVKKFYGIRSAIVHGGIPDDRDIIPVTADVFHLSAGILRNILVDSDLAATFNTELARRQLWNKFLFS